MKIREAIQKHTKEGRQSLLSLSWESNMGQTYDLYDVFLKVTDQEDVDLREYCFAQRENPTRHFDMRNQVNRYLDDFMLFMAERGYQYSTVIGHAQRWVLVVQAELSALGGEWAPPKSYEVKKRRLARSASKEKDGGRLTKYIPSLTHGVVMQEQWARKMEEERDRGRDWAPVKKRKKDIRASLGLHAYQAFKQIEEGLEVEAEEIIESETFALNPGMLLKKLAATIRDYDLSMVASLLQQKKHVKYLSRHQGMIIAQLILYTGLRISDVLSLTEADFVPATQGQRLDMGGVPFRIIHKKTAKAGVMVCHAVPESVFVLFRDLVMNRRQIGPQDRIKFLGGFKSALKSIPMCHGLIQTRHKGELIQRPMHEVLNFHDLRALCATLYAESGGDAAAKLGNSGKVVRKHYVFPLMGQQDLNFLAF